MAIRRQKLDRKVNLTLDGDRVVDMPPDWAFTIDCPHHGKITFDFMPYRQSGREDLAGHMRDAFWNLRNQVVGITLRGYENSGLRPFWRFIEALKGNGEPITRLDQINRKLLDRYLAWLALQVTSEGKNKGQPWSLGAKKAAFKTLKALLVNRQKRNPAVVSPELNFPRNPFPYSNRLIPKREAYSGAEQKRILAALNTDLRGIHEGEVDPLTPLQVLGVHLLVLALATGRNQQSLLELRRDSLREHPLDDRELLVTTKRRGYSTHSTSLAKAAEAPADPKSLQTIPASIGDHIRFFCEFTADLAAEADERDREFVFLQRIESKHRRGVVEKVGFASVTYVCKAFVKRHGLLDDSGHPLMLNIARLRPTFANELYRRTRDIRRVQQALGQASVQTTARHYLSVPLEAERDHSMVVDAMVGAFTRQEIDGKVLLAADGKIPLQDVKDLLSGGYNTGIARCKNPFRENESVCKKFFACFKCPSMCVFEDDLWRLFSFYYRLLAERAKINPIHWLKTYSPILRRIDADIASQFPPDKVEAARLKAQQTPHPAWKGPLL